jgi:hypothetical protein
MATLMGLRDAPDRLARRAAARAFLGGALAAGGAGRG